MGWYGPQSGDCSCCVTPCEYINAGSYSADDFIVLSGSFTFGGSITCTASGQLKCDAPDPSQYDHSMQGRFPDGQSYLVDYQDANNHFRVERTSSTSVELVEVSGGSPTVLETYSISASVSFVRICVTGNAIYVTNFISASLLSDSGVTLVTRLNAPSVVLELVTSDSDTSFWFARSGCKEPCKGFSCEKACTGGFPDSVFVELGWLGSFVLDNFPYDNGGGSIRCIWRWEEQNNDACAGPNRIEMSLYPGFGSLFGVRVYFYANPSVPFSTAATYTFDNTDFTAAYPCLPRDLSWGSVAPPPSGCGYPAFPLTGYVEEA